MRAELQIEERVADVLAGVRVTDPSAVARRDRAAAARKAYRGWLAQRLDGSVAVADDDIDTDTEPIMAEFLAHLVALVEQPMLHAFFLWHGGNPSAADNAWRLSGAAMLYGTAIVRHGASQGRVPTPATIPAVGMATSAEDAFDRDISLVTTCMDLGRRAAEAQADDATARLCVRIANDCQLISDMKMDQTFPAQFGRSQVFESFAATRERHL